VRYPYVARWISPATPGVGTTAATRLRVQRGLKGGTHISVHLSVRFKGLHFENHFHLAVFEAVFVTGN
jgi:hypothetical protein